MNMVMGIMVMGIGLWDWEFFYCFLCFILDGGVLYSTLGAYSSVCRKGVVERILSKGILENKLRN